MFDPNSRYAGLSTKTHKTAQGREIKYVSRRFLPRGEQMPVLTEVTVSDGDRLDTLTARLLGDAEQFWRVCDANNVMNPDDLLAEPGAKVKIPIPQV